LFYLTKGEGEGDGKHSPIYPSGYASQHIWCLSQARINGMVLSGRAFGVKMVEMVRWGHQLVWMRWQSIWIVGASACVIFSLHQKIQNDGEMYLLVLALPGCP